MADSNRCQAVGHVGENQELSNMLMLLRQRKLLIPNPNLMRPSVVVAVIT